MKEMVAIPLVYLQPVRADIETLPPLRYLLS